MKTLANCSPREFMRQTVLMRQPVAKWLKDTGIPELRKRMPEGYDDMTPEERTQAVQKQSLKNISDMLFAAFEKDEEGTLTVLAMCCFTPVEKVNDHPMTEYMKAVLDMFKNEVVRDFFTFLVQ